MFELQETIRKVGEYNQLQECFETFATEFDTWSQSDINFGISVENIQDTEFVLKLFKRKVKVSFQNSGTSRICF